MDHELVRNELGPWIELICQAGDERARDRLLLEGVIAVGCAEAAALWRPFADGWREVRSRGSADRLPGRAQFDALRTGALSSDTLPGLRVVAAEQVALALGGVTSDDETDGEALDSIEALVTLFALVDETRGLDVFPSALPADKRCRPVVDALAGRALRHDLANVLTSVRATEDLLARLAGGMSPDETQRFRAVVEAELTRAGELLATAFVRRGGPSEPRARIVDVLREVLQAEEASLRRAGLRVESFLEPGAARLAVPMSPGDLARVFQNLIVNAREAAGRGAAGTLWITVRVPDEHDLIRISIEDDGPGIAEQDLERIFQPGFSTKPTGSDGQGLSIVRGLIEAAGGSIQASIRPSGGARFEMNFRP